MAKQIAYTVFNVYTAAEGGRSFADWKAELADRGITDVRRVASPYVGQYGIRVPKKDFNKADRLFYGHR